MHHSVDLDAQYDKDISSLCSLTQKFSLQTQHGYDLFDDSVCKIVSHRLYRQVVIWQALHVLQGQMHLNPLRICRKK